MHKFILKEYSLLSDTQHSQLLEIRNMDYVRAQSLSHSIISIDEHLKWVKGLQHDSNRLFLALIKDEKILGGINLFNIDERAKWGIFLAESNSLIVKSLLPIFFIDFIFKNYSINRLYADIRVENTNAISYNKNLGFQLLHQDSELVLMGLEKEKFLDAKSSKILSRIIKKFALYNFSIER